MWYIGNLCLWCMISASCVLMSSAYLLSASSCFFFALSNYNVYMYNALSFELLAPSVPAWPPLSPFPCSNVCLVLSFVPKTGAAAGGQCKPTVHPYGDWFATMALEQRKQTFLSSSVCRSGTVGNFRLICGRTSGGIVKCFRPRPNSVARVIVARVW